MARIVSIEECVLPIQFFSENKDALQVGVSRCNKGDYIQNHFHNQFPRNTDLLNEVLYVVQGSIRANLYDDEKRLIASEEVRQNEFIILLSGGHGFEPLTDNSIIFEAKNGPFVSVEHDKTKF